MTKTDRETTKLFEETGAVFTDPLIVHPGGWGEDTPAEVREKIVIERLASLMRGEELGTWGEVCVYLMSASGDAPLTHEWTEIYQYAFTRHLPDKVPDILRMDEISSYQEGLLLDLRAKIWKARHKARKERTKVCQTETKQSISPSTTSVYVQGQLALIGSPTTTQRSSA